MKKSLFILIFGILSTLNYAQEKNDIESQKVFRINFLNPAIELEIPTGKYSTFSSALGVGYGGGYPDLTYAGNGFIYIITPFADFQQKWFYNLNKRNGKNRNTENNSGNFVSLRFITRGNSIAENVNRTSDFDFAFRANMGNTKKIWKEFSLTI